RGREGLCVGVRRRRWLVRHDGPPIARPAETPETKKARSGVRGGPANRCWFLALRFAHRPASSAARLTRAATRPPGASSADARRRRRRVAGGGVHAEAHMEATVCSDSSKSQASGSSQAEEATIDSREWLLPRIDPKLPCASPCAS